MTSQAGVLTVAVSHAVDIDLSNIATKTEIFDLRCMLADMKAAFVKTGSQGWICSNGGNLSGAKAPPYRLPVSARVRLQKRRTHAGVAKKVSGPIPARASTSKKKLPSPPVARFTRLHIFSRAARAARTS